LQSDETSSVLALSEAELEAIAVTEESRAAEAHGHKKLESTAVRATFWIVVDYGAAQGLRVVSSMILTRLLMPEAVGLMTLVSTLMIGISLISDIGLNSSIIQSSRGDDPVFLNTAWTVQVLRGLGIFVAALLLAWPMSLIYHEPRLLWLMIALGGEIVIDAFKSTNLLSMARHMGVRRTFALDVTSQIVGLAVTAGFAYMLRSVWALVIGVVLNTLYRVIMSHNPWVMPGIRNRFCWDKASAHELVHFGKWILLSTALFFFASQADRLMMGKLVSLSLLGVYGIAYSVSDIPRAIINAFTGRVGFPFIAKMVHLPIAEFRKVFLRYRFRTLLGGGALLAFVVHVGGILVAIMYDSRYHGASWMVPVLALGLWHTLMYSTTYPALLALGKSKYGAIGNACYMVTIISAIWIGFHSYGMFGAVVAVAIGDFPIYIVYTIGASREKLSTWLQDLQATAAFLVFLGIGLAIRKAIGV
jgi:O-antigen/teichoic acid export membrane protein